MAWKLKKEKPMDRIKEAEEEDFKDKARAAYKSSFKPLPKPEPEEEKEEEPEMDEPRAPMRKTTKERIKVVKEIPVQEVRTVKDSDGTIIHLITIEEALDRILNSED